MARPIQASRPAGVGRSVSQELCKVGPLRRMPKVPLLRQTTVAPRADWPIICTVPQHLTHLCRTGLEDLWSTDRVSPGGGAPEVLCLMSAADSPVLAAGVLTIFCSF